MGFRSELSADPTTPPPLTKKKMKAFVAVSALLATVAANQTSHQVIKHGNAPAVSHSVHKPHGSHAAVVATHTPVHPLPVVHRPPPYHPAPVVVAHPAPVYHPAPVVHKPAPYHPAPAYKQPSYDEPAVYQYGYAVTDDYSGVNFAQNENRDGYATTGEYRVALPDGRTQIVTYNTADAYSGNVADVKYEGEAHYEPYHPAPVKVHPAPAYHA